MVPLRIVVRKSTAGRAPAAHERSVLVDAAAIVARRLTAIVVEEQGLVGSYRRRAVRDCEVGSGFDLILDDSRVVNVQGHIVGKAPLVRYGLRWLIVRVAVVHDPVGMVRLEPCEVMARD